MDKLGRKITTSGKVVKLLKNKKIVGLSTTYPQRKYTMNKGLFKFLTLFHRCGKLQKYGCELRVDKNQKRNV